MLNVFVYGTLKPNECRWDIIEPYVKEATRGFIYGSLYDLGAFPAVSFENSNDTVTGYMLTFANDDILNELDAIEGYVGIDDDRNLYDRSYKTFYSTKHKEGVPCLVYHMRNTKMETFNPIKVVDGNWEARSRYL